MVDVRHERFVLLAHRLPVHAVHGRIVEEIAHLPPAFLEDLLPLPMVIRASFPCPTASAASLIVTGPLGRSMMPYLPSWETSIFLPSAEISKPLTEPSAVSLRAARSYICKAGLLSLLPWRM